MKTGENARDCDREEGRVRGAWKNRGEGGHGIRKWLREGAKERVRERKHEKEIEIMKSKSRVEGKGHLHKITMIKKIRNGRQRNGDGESGIGRGKEPELRRRRV